MSIEMALRIHGHTVTRAELGAFYDYLLDVGTMEARAYVDHETDAIVIEAQLMPVPSAKDSDNRAPEGKFDLAAGIFAPREKTPGEG